MGIQQNSRAKPLIAKVIAAARRQCGWTQQELANRVRLTRQELTYFESGTRTPNLPKLVRIASALGFPFQRFLSGSDRPGNTPRELALELRHYGLVDLWVADALVPGAFRRVEEVIARAAGGSEPQSRILEGLPAMLAWNRWEAGLLRAYARQVGPQIACRLAWLADIALALERQGGFPGGCPSKDRLVSFVRRIHLPKGKSNDDVGHPSTSPPKSPIWRRWHIRYDGDLPSFRRRSESLVSTARSEGIALPFERGAFREE